MKRSRIVILRFGTSRQKPVLERWTNPKPHHPFGIVPLSNFVPRGFAFVHHSIAILYHDVPNPNLTIRNFLIAVHLQRTARAARVAVHHQPRRRVLPLRLGRAREEGVGYIG
jgi:hypothetical protein